MTLQIDGVDVATAIEVAGIVGGIVTMLVVGLLIYLLVRPPRRRGRERPAPEPDALDVEEMLRLIDRMEQRLEVLERAIAVEPKDERQLLEAGAQAPETRRAG